jgi:demethylmenaquinone methyltransferase/2-methoxy-6-polyprenyl-1,4-benzoquinol methylase
MEKPHTTDFGFQDIPIEEKKQRVGEVFRLVANRYDLMNDLMSLGLHRRWKNYTVNEAHLRPGMCVLDLAGGTGDLAQRMLPKLGPGGKIILADLSESMLQTGRRRAWDQGCLGIQYVQSDAEQLPFPPHTFDRITLAFGLRNMTDKPRVLQHLSTLLKPGGQLLVLEFSKPVLPLLGKLYDRYSFALLPRLGQWLTGSADSYHYLVESIRRHPDQTTLKTMMVNAGFDQCDYVNLSGGIVCLHRARTA